MQDRGSDDATDTVLIVGAGSLGTVYGAYLARAGCDVQLLCREPHGRAIRDAGGVLVEAPGCEPELVEVDAAWEPREVRPAYTVIVLTKTYDTADALDPLASIAGDVRLAVSLQNGLAKNDVLAAWCGADAVVGGASMVGGTMPEPGRVRHTFDGPTFVGELPEGESPRTVRFAELLSASGLEGRSVTDIRSVEWSKLAQVLPAMTVTALTRRYYHEVLLSPELAGVFVRLLKEVGAVAEASGVALQDWPEMLPVATLCREDDTAAVERVHGFGRHLESAGAVQITPSMSQSVQRGSRLEVEEIQGFVVREAARVGVEVPTVATCYELLAGVDRIARRAAE